MSERVLGLGGTVDYEIAWDSAVIEDLVDDYAIRADELDARIPVVDERSLVVTLLAFLRDGVGGERFVASSDIVEVFAARFDTRITLGGTCVRAAIAMRSLGLTSLVHLVSIDDHVRALLPEGVEYVSSASADSTDPHLIVQFAAGAAVRRGELELVAPHPNRIIYTNDAPNRELVLSDDLGTALGDASGVPGLGLQHDPGCRGARRARRADPRPRRRAAHRRGRDLRGRGLPRARVQPSRARCARRRGRRVQPQRGRALRLSGSHRRPAGRRRGRGRARRSRRPDPRRVPRHPHQALVARARRPGGRLRRRAAGRHRDGEHPLPHRRRAHRGRLRPHGRAAREARGCGRRRGSRGTLPRSPASAMARSCSRPTDPPPSDSATPSSAGSSPHSSPSEYPRERRRLTLEPPARALLPGWPAHHRLPRRTSRR